MSPAFSALAAKPDLPPSRPAAPTAVPNAPSKKIPENPFRCDRLIKFRGRTLPCDSALRRDGESLRSILDSTPDALEELDAYQAGRQSIRVAAYTGTAGLVMLLTSGLLADAFISKDRPDSREKTGRIIRYSGIGITLGSVVWGYSHLRSNEDHLNLAIIKYNATHPDRPIEVLFKTEF